MEIDKSDAKEASRAEIQNSWIEAQDLLKKRLVTEDDFRWQLPTTTTDGTAAIGVEGEEECGVLLKYVGGVDISFAKDDPSIACGTLVVLDLQTLQVVYEDYCVVTLQIPYVPGFLAFREAPILLPLLEKMKTCDHPFSPQLCHVSSSSNMGVGKTLDLRFLPMYCGCGRKAVVVDSKEPATGTSTMSSEKPSCNSGQNTSSQNSNSFALICALGFTGFLELPPNITAEMLMVDGNGILHPRGFGLACHLGVLANLPTIGIGKNLHHVDGLAESKVRQVLETEGIHEDILTLRGDSGRTWGAAMRSNPGSFKPIYISVGHRLSLATAVKIARMTCKYRIPEPIRQADMRSREYLRKHQSSG